MRRKRGCGLNDGIGLAHARADLPVATPSSHSGTKRLLRATADMAGVLTDSMRWTFSGSNCGRRSQRQATSPVISQSRPTLRSDGPILAEA